MFCAACGAQILDRGAFCTRCGRPVSTTQHVTVDNVYRGKNLQIVGSIISLGGVITCMSSCSTQDSYDSGHTLAIGALILVVGIVLVMVGKYQHWYHAE